jgi:hypothetical protein
MWYELNNFLKRQILPLSSFAQVYNCIILHLRIPKAYYSLNSCYKLVLAFTLMENSLSWHLYIAYSLLQNQIKKEHHLSCFPPRANYGHKSGNTHCSICIAAWRDQHCLLMHTISIIGLWGYTILTMDCFVLGLLYPHHQYNRSPEHTTTFGCPSIELRPHYLSVWTH